MVPRATRVPFVVRGACGTEGILAEAARVGPGRALYPTVYNGRIRHVKDCGKDRMHSQFGDMCERLRRKPNQLTPGRNEVADTGTFAVQRVSFEFVGGPHDGLVVQGRIDDHNRNEAAGLLWRTDGGQPGTDFWVPSDYAVHWLACTVRMDLIIWLSTGFHF